MNSQFSNRLQSQTDKNMWQGDPTLMVAIKYIFYYLSLGTFASFARIANTRDQGPLSLSQLEYYSMSEYFVW